MPPNTDLKNQIVAQDERAKELVKEILLTLDKVPQDKMPAVVKRIESVLAECKAKAETEKLEKKQ